MIGLPAVAPRQRSEGWSGVRESNSRLLLGKQVYYHYTNPARHRPDTDVPDLGRTGGVWSPMTLGDDTAVSLR